jgi:hypothetical protein
MTQGFWPINGYPLGEQYKNRELAPVNELSRVATL